MNLREFFKFTKSFKIFFILWSLLLVGFIIAFIIFSNLADKRILEATVTLRSFPPIHSSDIYRYETKIHFPSNIFRFQRNISNIEILTYMWDIDSHSFNPIYENGRLYLETKETMQNANQIIGKITYKTDFIPSFILDLCLYYISLMLLLVKMYINFQFQFLLHSNLYFFLLLILLFFEEHIFDYFLAHQYFAYYY